MPRYFSDVVLLSNYCCDGCLKPRIQLTRNTRLSRPSVRCILIGGSL